VHRRKERIGGKVAGVRLGGCAEGKERRWGEVGPLKRKYIGGLEKKRRKDKMVVWGNIYIRRWNS
jgi:hypothetical protein